MDAAGGGGRFDPRPHRPAVERSVRTSGTGPLFLQDHGSPTRYRNVWIRPL
jgi:hypothetical protein